MESLLSDEEYIPQTSDSSEEYDEENDTFLQHRDSDILCEIMNEYEKEIENNLYDSIEMKLNIKNPKDLIEIFEFLIASEISFTHHITFIKNHSISLSA